MGLQGWAVVHRHDCVRIWDVAGRVLLNNGMHFGGGSWWWETPPLGSRQGSDIAVRVPRFLALPFVFWWCLAQEIQLWSMGQTVMYIGNTILAPGSRLPADGSW